MTDCPPWELSRPTTQSPWAGRVSGVGRVEPREQSTMEYDDFVVVTCHEDSYNRRRARRLCLARLICLASKATLSLLGSHRSSLDVRAVDFSNGWGMTDLHPEPPLCEYFSCYISLGCNLLVV